MQSLLAVLLVVRSRPGPQLVYRYPPRAQRLSAQDVRSKKAAYGSDSDSDSDGDVNGLASLRRRRSKHSFKPSQESAQTTVSDPAAAESDSFLGFSEDSLERLLAPGTWSDGKKFEVCLDGMTFVGHPIHAYEDGRWTRARPHRKDHAASTQMPSEEYGDYTNFGITVTEPLSPVRTNAAQRDWNHMPESFDSQLGRSLGTSFNSASSTSTIGAEQLSMFNVVFVLDTANATGSEQAVQDMYKHVVKKLSKALHYCQKQSSYVGIETRRLLTLYARAKQEHTSFTALQQQIQETSELAWALKEVYESISKGEIAGVRLNGQALSLHVPPKTPENEQTIELDASAGLLLLEDKGALLRELSHPDASPLVYFIREHTPTKSLQKLATRLGMSVEETLYLARHLVKWRKGRAILPLHPLNTYIVSPQAPTERLADFLTDYARRFPGLPSLPQMLRFLSGRPIKYGILMPSRDHRAPYMDILAYLVKHGFVAQLCTYGWLRRIPRRKKVKSESNVNGKTQAVNQNQVPLSVASLLSPQLRAVDDDVVSVSSERTAIPLGMPKSEPSKPSVSTTRSSPGGEGFSEEGMPAEPWAVILDPLDPDDEEAEFLANVREAVDDPELSDRLPSLWKYFTGEEALESIAAQEGLKRSLVERWIDTLQREGLLTTFRRV